MVEEKQYLTKEKFEELQKELEQLKTVRRKEVAQDLEYAKSLGDLSENAEYHEARDLQANIEDRIMRLDTLLKAAEIVSTHGTDKVNVGSTVTLEKDGTKKKYEIVGTEEADITQGKLSTMSPLGEVLLGKKKGEKFTFSSRQGNVEYKIISIE